MTGPPNDSPERRIGPYAVIGAIGGGSVWGDLVQAIDEEQQRYVSVLLIPPERLAPPGARERLTQIAQALFQLDHPNTVRYYNIVAGDQQPHLVKEYCGDTSLQTLITHGDLPPMPVLADFLAQACRGLRAGWELSLAHGALTPAQLMIAPSGSLKVNEIGLIQALCGPKDPDAAVEALADAALYAAPERAAGQRPDWPADLFSLGAIFYHVLSGVPPFGDAPDKEARLAPLTPLTALNKNTPPELWRVIERMMDPDPPARYASFGEAIMALKEAGAGILEQAFGEQTGQAENQAAADVAEPLSTGTEPPEQVARSPLARHSINEYMDQSRVDVPASTTAPRKSGTRPQMLMIVALFLICIAAVLMIWGKSEGPTDQYTIPAILHDVIAKLFGGTETAAEGRRRQRSITRENMLLIDAATQEFLIYLRRRPNNLQDLIDEGYMETNDAVDGWGREFLYNLALRTIRSFGADGIEDTSDDFLLVEGEFIQQPVKDDTELLDEDF